MCLVLLHLSAAFDTVDHTIILQRWEMELGVTGTVLSWIKSYLTNCTQWVVIGDPIIDGVRSDKISLSFWVLQGSVLNPIHFMLYTCPLGYICKKQNVLYLLYTDDQQIYLTFHPGSTRMQSGQPGTVDPQESCLSRIENWTSEIRKWITHNMLKLDDKTEFIIFGTRQQLKKVTNIQLCIENTEVVPVETVRNLGFFRDKLLKNTNLVNKLTSSQVYQLSTHD